MAVDSAVAEAVASAAVAVADSAAAEAVASAAAVVAVADGSEYQCQEPAKCAAAPNGRRAPVLPSVKFHNAQGPHEPGGPINYVDNGEMTRGFALIA